MDFFDKLERMNPSLNLNTPDKSNKYISISKSNEKGKFYPSSWFEYEASSHSEMFSMPRFIEILKFPSR